MTIIKNFKQFNEAISGTEIPTNRNFSYFGAAYGTENSPNTIDTSKNSLRSSISGDILSEYDYQELLNKYLKTGKSINDLPEKGFCPENIDYIKLALYDDN
jgi:hypothetical protein